MNRIVLEHNINTEYKKIREITLTYVTVGGVEKLFGNHRGGQIVPGALVDDVYVITDTSGYSADVQGLATACWSPAIHTAYEASLRA